MIDKNILIGIICFAMAEISLCIFILNANGNGIFEWIEFMSFINLFWIFPALAIFRLEYLYEENETI